MADYNLLKVAIPEDTRVSEPTNQNNKLNPRTYTQIHTPTVVQGRGVDGTPPRSFSYVAVF